MIVPLGSAVGLALLLAGSAAQAQGFQYAPGSASYDVVSSTKIEQEAMGQTQELEIASRQLLTVEIARKTGDTLGLTVRIDSIEVRHSQQGVVDVSAVVGLTVAADLTHDGTVQAVRAPAGLDANQAEQLAHMLPRVRGVLKTGTVWVDTLAAPLTQGGLVMQRRVITTARVLGDTVANGGTAWRIQRVSQTTVAGSGDVQGQPLAVEGTGTGGGTWVVSSEGQFLGATLDDEMRTTVTMSATGLEVKGVTQATTSVTRRGS